MGRRSHYEGAVIPSRFLITLGHLLATLFVFGVKEECVDAGLGGSDVESGRRAANANINSALAVAIMCFCLDFSSLLLGFSIFIDKVSPRSARRNRRTEEKRGHRPFPSKSPVLLLGSFRLLLIFMADQCSPNIPALYRGYFNRTHGFGRERLQAAMVRLIWRES